MDWAALHTAHQWVTQQLKTITWDMLSQVREGHGLVWFPPRHRITCILVSSTSQCLEESPAKPKVGSPLSLWLYDISQLLESFSVTKIQWSMITFSVFECSSLLEDARKRQTLSKLSFSRSRYKPTWNKWDIHILCLWRRKCNTLTTGFWIY